MSLLKRFRNNRCYKVGKIAGLILIASIANQSGATPVAFPGAVGFGAVATGGRAGTVYHVTNLNDSGTGSFRDAVSSSNRIVVFDVGGTISLSSAVSVKSNITIAGQTAPGDGIAIISREVSFSNSSNDIVRYIRFRQGRNDPDSSKSGINLLNTSNMIFDHVSIEFAQWNNIDAVTAVNWTLQNSIDADPTGQQFNAHCEGGPVTFYNNIFANAHNRSPLAKTDTQYVNNVVYNYQAGYTAGNTAGVHSHDIIDNYFITGPSTTSASNAFYQMNGQQVYISGNLLDSNNDASLNGSTLGYPGSTVHLTSPWSASLPTTSAAAAYAYDVAYAGDSLPRDAVDAQVIADVTSLGTSGHLWTTQTSTGLSNSGYGTLIGGTAPTDTDQDGIPNYWETAHGLNPNSASDGNTINSSTGYSNLETYINQIADAGVKSGITYKLVPRHAESTNQVLDVTGGSATSGTNVETYGDNGGTSQQWRIDIVSDGLYRLTPACASSCALTATSTGNVDSETWAGTGNQLWKIVDDANGYRLLEPDSVPADALDVYGARTASGTNVDIYANHNSNNQQWKLVPLN